MRYTLEQIAFLLGKHKKTIYRAYVEHGVGKLCEVEEGRRLMFTEEEYVFLRDLFYSKKRNELMKRKNIRKVIDVLKVKPMTAYELARELGLQRNTTLSLLVSMTPVFHELWEDDDGTLHFEEE